MWLYVPSFCRRIYSPLLPWITLTTTKLMVLGTLTSGGQLAKSVIEDEKELQNTRPTHRLISEDVQSIHDPIGWSAFHANAREPRDIDVTITYLLPLFPDDSKSVVMIRHSMDFVKSIRLNLGQFLTQDLLLFVIVKLI